LTRGASAQRYCGPGDPRSTPLELQAAVPDYMVPFAPILQEGEQPFAMFVDLQRKYDWVLDVIRYPSVERLIEGLEDKMVRRAEAKFNHLLTRRTKQTSCRDRAVCAQAPHPTRHGGSRANIAKLPELLGRKD
jgi:hypothetical protein